MEKVMLIYCVQILSAVFRSFFKIWLNKWWCLYMSTEPCWVLGPRVSHSEVRLCNRAVTGNPETRWLPPCNYWSLS